MSFPFGNSVPAVNFDERSGKVAAKDENFDEWIVAGLVCQKTGYTSRGAEMRADSSAGALSKKN